MKRTRDDTLFDLRYAVRVLERHASLWGHVAAAFKFATLLSGTVAIAALVATNKNATIGMGMLFAGLQALEYALAPGDRRASAFAMRREYARVLAAQADSSDEALEAAYQAAVQSDEIEVREGLKELAFNDVVREQGRPLSTCFPERRLLRAIS